MDAIAADAPFFRLGGLNTVAATHHSEAMENIKASLKLPYSKIQQLPEYQKLKHGKPIALAGGGPSIKKTVDELREFKTIVACGSAHDWLIEQGIEPRYCLVADPDPVITAKYLQHPCPNTIYMIASQCHESVFKAVEGYPVVLWHCYSEEHRELLDELDNGWVGIAGGCTAGLRAISMALMFGYRDMHFFGFDSCLADEDQHHAYDFNDPTAEDLGQIYNIKTGFYEAGKRTYRCAGYQLAQAVHFKSFYAAFGHLFQPTFHGDGLMPDMWRDIMAESTRQQLEKQEQAA